MNTGPVLFGFSVGVISLAAALQVESAFARHGFLHIHHYYSQGVCSVLSRHPCAPTVCSVFHRGPCIPEIEYPIGQDLRLTITTAASDGDARGNPAIHSNEPKASTGKELNTIRDVFNALRECWVPPPESEARAGMQMSVRFSFKNNGEIISSPRVTYKSPDAPPEAISKYHNAIMEALNRCTPLPFTRGLGNAVAGRPIAIRFVDDRRHD